MNSLIQRVLYGSILLFLTACTHYPHQAYYPAGGAYTSYNSGYVVSPGTYNGGYPYRYDNYAYPVYGQYGHNHHHDDGGYDANRSWNRSRLKANPSKHYNHHTEQRNQQWAYKEPATRYLDRPHHQDADHLRKLPNNYPQRQHDRQHVWSNPNPQNYRQQQRPDDSRDYNRGSPQNEWAAKKPIRDHARFHVNPDKSFRKANQDQPGRQRKNRDKDHQQSFRYGSY